MFLVVLIYRTSDFLMLGRQCPQEKNVEGVVVGAPSLGLPKFYLLFPPIYLVSAEILLDYRVDLLQ